MDKILYLIRGLPGSGKTTLALKLYHYYTDFRCNQNVCWVETDFYFNIDGEYKFDASKLGEANDWNQRQVANDMKNKASVIIVSNNFSHLWELEPYEEMAKAYGYQVQILHCEGQFKNRHQVPEENIQKMRANWEPYNQRFTLNN